MLKNTLLLLTRAPVQAISMQLTLQAPIAPHPHTDLHHYYYNYSVHHSCSLLLSRFITLIILSQQIKWYSFIKGNQ